MKQNYNFCAGPSMIPNVVLKQVQEELLNWNNSGRSVMELSHRSPEFASIAESSENTLRELMSIPDNYHVLYCHGGGSGQFSAIPLNLIEKSQSADYVVSGHWSELAAAEASKYCHVNVIDIRHNVEGKDALLSANDWQLSDNASYLFVCPNETISGLEIHDLPQTDKPIIADMPSSILSRPLDVAKYGVIYAGAQKNIGPAGLTLVIVRDDLLDKVKHTVPAIFDYKTLVEKSSMVNTPPTFAWYIAGLVFNWLKNIGGIEVIYNTNLEKAKLLYEAIDQSSLFINNVHSDNRSIMNVVFNLENKEITHQFIERADNAGFYALKGHQSVGGIRASIYNAMPLAGVQSLVQFMKDFEKNMGTQ